MNGAGVGRVANTSNLYFDHVEAEALVIALDLKGLAVSGGSACQSGATEPSHVLTAMGLSEARARASVRFSLSRLNTEAEVDAVLEMVPAAVARLRELSPRSWPPTRPRRRLVPGNKVECLTGNRGEKQRCQEQRNHVCFFFRQPGKLLSQADEKQCNQFGNSVHSCLLSPAGSVTNTTEYPRR